jgi:hypothetical protein
MLADPEIFTPNADFNTRFHELIPSFDEGSQRRIVCRLRRLRRAAEQDRRTEIRARISYALAELEIGARLRDSGYAVEYESELDGMTPDWLDVGARLLVEVVNAGLPAKMCQDIDRNGMWCGFAESDGIPVAVGRAFSAIDSKIGTYKAVIDRHELSYVVAVCGAFENDAEMCDGRIAVEKWDLFNDRPHLSGVVYFVLGANRSYDYIPNCSAIHPVDLSAIGNTSGKPSVG